MRDLHDTFLRPEDFQDSEELQSEDDSRTFYRVGLALAAFGGAALGVGVMMVVAL
jgi:hypothetical protein